MEVGAPQLPTRALVHVQAQIFEVVASDGQLLGTTFALAHRFGTTTDGLLTCLDGLIHAGWVTVVSDSGGLIRIRLEL
jgi:hypothetical protein